MANEAAERLLKWCEERARSTDANYNLLILDQDDLREAMVVALEEAQKRHMRSVDIRALIAALKKEKP